MPFFSFSVNDNSFLLNEFNVKPNKIYFSKNTYIWKKLNKEKNHKPLLLKREKRKKLINLGKKVLFCLPPSIGLGDAIEYAHALKALKKNNIFKNFGIAFCENYSFLFNDYFSLEKLYPSIISNEEIMQYDSLFHFTLEIEAIKNQEYNRSNIEYEIKKYFKIYSKPFFPKSLKTAETIKKISIFPISNSPIRTMPKDVLQKIINFIKKNFLVEIFVDKQSEISNYLFKDINIKNFIVIDSKNKAELVNSIKEIDYGIFMDSGPLHIAKLFKKKGVLIQSSVSHKILLNEHDMISPINNNFSSIYCNSPCGLTDIFNYKGKIGCYHSLRIKKNVTIKNNLSEFFGRRGVKNNYLNYIQNPVGCLKALDVQNILNYIKKDLSL